MKGFTVLGKGVDIMKRFDMSTIFSVSVLIVLIVAGCAEIHRPGLDADSYVKRGLTYADKGQYDKDISDYNKAIEINPRDADAYSNRGTAYDTKGQYDKAISDYNKAIEINPRLADAYYNRGIAYGKRGQYDKAISDYSKAIEINPRDADAYYNLLTLAKKLTELQLKHETLSYKSHELEEDIQKLEIKVLSGNGNINSAKEMAKRLGNMGYKIKLFHYAPRSDFSQNTVYSTPKFRKEAKRLVDRLGGSTIFKDLSWPSAFDLIVVTGKNT